MNKKQYQQQLQEIMKQMQIKFQALQESLTEEELFEYTPYFPISLLQFIERFVGREDLLSFLITLLGLADSIVNPADRVRDRQIERANKIMEENQDDKTRD
jgi:hypothetical protein